MHSLMIALSKTSWKHSGITHFVLDLHSLAKFQCGGKPMARVWILTVGLTVRSQTFYPSTF
jgi:hypothetical protein